MVCVSPRPQYSKKLHDARLLALSGGKIALSVCSSRTSETEVKREGIGVLLVERPVPAARVDLGDRSEGKMEWIYSETVITAFNVRRKTCASEQKRQKRRTNGRVECDLAVFKRRPARFFESSVPHLIAHTRKRMRVRTHAPCLVSFKVSRWLPMWLF